MAPLMATFIKRMKVMTSSPETAPKMAIVMGHDSTLLPMLAAIFNKEWDGKWTPFASMLIMELYQASNTTHYVRVLYKNTPMVIPGCNDGKILFYFIFFSP